MSKISKITVGSDYNGTECLHVWPSAHAAREAIDTSPRSDGVMMSTTTFHRPATAEDVARLIYDRDGEEVLLHD